MHMGDKLESFSIGYVHPRSSMRPEELTVVSSALHGMAAESLGLMPKRAPYNRYIFIYGI